MLNKRSLDPEHRVLYGASLQAPVGYTFDGGVATTFSLDFETALAVPVSLALFAAENRDEILKNPLALLEGAERIADKLAVFAQAGRIQANARPYSRLCSLLEKIVVEVSVPNGGVFHPKLWVLRYAPQRPEDPVRIRLLILSRNLTRDRSWDMALVLDGIVGKRHRADNKPLVQLLRKLPEPTMPTVAVSDSARTLVNDIAESLHHAEWDLPYPFDTVAFAVNGLGGKSWQPEACSRFGLVSPFCDEAALTLLADLPADAAPVFIGRSDELAKIPAKTLDRYAQVAVMDEMSTSEDGEEQEETALDGLHAKVFVAERGWDVSITVGSGNATRPALISGQNVEVFATLNGKRSKVGSVEEILGPQGFGRLTRPFIREELPAEDAAQRDAEARVDAARDVVCRIGLRLRCERAAAEPGHSVWRLWLSAPAPLPLEGIGNLRVWPITRGEGHARDALVAFRQGAALDLGVMPLADLTRFLAFELTDETGQASLLFSTGLAIDGLPAERHAAILRSVIDSKEAFFRYLRLLLSEIGDPFGAALAASEGNGNGKWNAGQDDMPILEELVRAFCAGGEEFSAIDRLITRLDGAADGSADPVPADFRELWKTFRIALASRKVAHGG